VDLTRTAMRGLVLGTVAGFLYVASRRTTNEPPRLIQWDRARKIAQEMARRDQGAAVFPDSLGDDYRAMVRRSEETIGNYLKQSLPLPLSSVETFNRSQWIDANISSFQQLFEPLETMNRDALRGATIGTHLFGEINQAVLSGQLGILLGYLARRVLGQYDTSLLGKEPVTTGRLYFVEPNIATTQGKLGLDGNQFRMWIALHETTHAYEFEAHPWLRDYMNGLLRQYFDSVGRDLGRFAFGAGGVTGLAQRVWQNLPRTQTAIELFMTDEQKEIFQKLQALMCLLEGYSNHVMDIVGQDLLSTYPLMKQRFEARNEHRPLGDRLFTRLTGLDLKLEQYRLGEKFVNTLVRQFGIDNFNQVWEGPANLPTLAEIYEPERWLARVGAE
jgi:coenzyme F420 biosynthesis associated uncharacterized protein